MNWIPAESLVEFSVRALPILADSAVKAAVLLVAAAVGSALLRRSSASARHLVWALALGGLLLLPILSAALPKLQIPVLPPTLRTDGTDRTDRANWTDPTGSTAASAPASRESGDAGPASPSPSAAGRKPAQQGETDPLLAALSSATGVSAPPSHTPNPWALRIATAWALGALAALLPLLGGFLCVRRLVARARPFDERRWLALIRSMAESLGLRRTVRVLRSDADAMPMACGILRPAILLPRAIQDWPDEKRRTVLLHELAHVRRRDCLTHALGRLACALHWFNPLAWWALRRMRVERERACDDLVLTAGERPSDYADHLLDIARSMRSGALLSAAAITMARPSHLEGRLLAILDPRRNRGAVKWWVIAAGIVVLLAVAVPLGMMKFTEHKVFADMTPEQRAAFEKWLTVPVALPPEALEVRPFSEETTRAVGDFYKEWERLDKATAEKKEKAIANALSSGGAETTFSEDLRYFEPLAEAFARVAAQPDYEAEVWGLNRNPGALSPEDFTARRAAYRALQAKTLSLWRSGNADRALEGLTVLLRAPICHPYSPSIVKMLSLSWVRTALDVAERMTTETDSPDFRQAVRARLVDVRDLLQPVGFRDDIDALTMDHIGMVRQHKRLGIDVGVADGAGLDWMIAACRCQLEALKRFSLPQAATPEERRQTEEYIAASEKSIELYESAAQARNRQSTWSNALARNASLIGVAVLYKIASPNAEHSLRLTRETFERYDRLIADAAPTPPRSGMVEAANTEPGTGESAADTSSESEAAQVVAYPDGREGRRVAEEFGAGREGTMQFEDKQGRRIEIRWEYLRDTSAGKTYRFKRTTSGTLPGVGEGVMEIRVTEIFYRGRPTEVFSDTDAWVGVETGPRPTPIAPDDETSPVKTLEIGPGLGSVSAASPVPSPASVPDAAFLDSLSTASFPIRLVSEQANESGEFSWVLDTEQPVCIARALLYLDENGRRSGWTGHGFEGVPAPGPVEFALETRLADGNLHLKIADRRDNTDTKRSVSTEQRTDVPEKTTFESRWIDAQGATVDARSLTALWEGRFVRDGKTLKTLVLVVAATDSATSLSPKPAGYGHPHDHGGLALPVVRLDWNAQSEAPSDFDNEQAMREVTIKLPRGTWRAELPNGAWIELVAIGEPTPKGKPAWKPDGTPTDPPKAFYESEMGTVVSATEPFTRVFYFETEGLQDVMDAPVVWRPTGYPLSARHIKKHLDGGERSFWPSFFASVPTTGALTFEIGVAGAPWKTLARLDPATAQRSETSDPGGTIKIESLPPPGSKQSAVRLTDNLSSGEGRQFRLVAVARDGGIRFLGVAPGGRTVAGSSEERREAGDGSTERDIVFDIPSREIAEYRFEASDYRWVEFKDVPLEPSKPAPKESARSIEIPEASTSSSLSEIEGSASSPRLQFRWVARDGERDSAEKFPFRHLDPRKADSETGLYLEKEILFSERDVLTAEVMPAISGEGFCVRFQLRADGATQRFADLTGENLNRRLAIVFDGKIFSAPVVRERIPNGAGIIGVGAKKEEAEAIVKAIAAPVSPVPPSMKGVIERTVGFDPHDSWLDLDTGGVFPPPVDNLTGNRVEEMVDWWAKRGIDFSVSQVGSRVDYAVFIGARVAVLDNSAWDLPSSDAQRLLRERLPAESGSNTRPPADAVRQTPIEIERLPMTIGFRTREGGLGLLQVLEHVRKDDRWGLRIRYRLLPPPQAGADATDKASRRTACAPVDPSSLRGVVGQAERFGDGATRRLSGRAGFQLRLGEASFILAPCRVTAHVSSTSTSRPRIAPAGSIRIWPSISKT